jgi:hypothetical protein
MVMRSQIKSRVRNYYLINLAVFLSLIPFVSPIPIDSDIQYPIFVICGLIVVRDTLDNRLQLNYVERYFVLLAIMSLIYINVNSDFEYSIFKRIGLSFSFIIFYVFSRYWKIVNPFWLIVGVYVNVVAVILQYGSPHIFEKIGGLFVRQIKYVDGAARGVTGLTPESGFLGAVSIYAILIFYALYKEKRISSKKFYTVVFVEVLIILMTKSGTGFLMLGVLLFMAMLLSSYQFWKKMFIFSTVILLCYLYLYEFSSTGRGPHIARNIIKDPQLVFVVDKSVAYRAVSISVGVSSLLNGDLFGHGVGTLKYVANDILDGTYLGDIYTDVNDSAGGLLSSLAQYTVEMGVFFIALLGMLYFNTRMIPYIVIIRVMSIFYLLASFSILFPPLWILLACTTKNNVGKSYS